jgi:hypothetical protein
MSKLRPRTLPTGFVAPCPPTSARQHPLGPEWLIEIKHDGFRVIARKIGNRVRLYPTVQREISTHAGFRLAQGLPKRLKRVSDIPPAWANLVVVDAVLLYPAF